MRRVQWAKRVVRWQQDCLSRALREVRVSHKRIQRRWSLDAEVLTPLSVSTLHVQKPAKGPGGPVIRWVSRGDISDTSGQESDLTGPDRSLWGLWFYSWWDEKVLVSWVGETWPDLHFVMFTQAALWRRDCGHKILGSRLFSRISDSFLMSFFPLIYKNNVVHSLAFSYISDSLLQFSGLDHTWPTEIYDETHRFKVCRKKNEVKINRWAWI